MQPGNLLRSVALALALPSAAMAGQVLEYDGYALGLPVAHLTIALDDHVGGYDATVSYRITGVAGALLASRQTASASGRWDGARAAPDRFQVAGEAHGTPRDIRIHYAGGVPVVDRAVPADDGREPVPAASLRGTVDTISAMAAMLRRAATNGDCGMEARVFDGRRLIDVRSRRGAEKTMRVGRVFDGAARACEVEGTLIAGFQKGGGESLRQTKRGTVWLAPVRPGGPAVPVRARFETPWIGHVSMELTSAR